MRMPTTINTITITRDVLGDGDSSRQFVTKGTAKGPSVKNSKGELVTTYEISGDYLDPVKDKVIPSQLFSMEMEVVEHLFEASLINYINAEHRLISTSEVRALEGSIPEVTHISEVILNDTEYASEPVTLSTSLTNFIDDSESFSHVLIAPHFYGSADFIAYSGVYTFTRNSEGNLVIKDFYYTQGPAPAIKQVHADRVLRLTFDVVLAIKESIAGIDDSLSIVTVEIVQLQMTGNAAPVIVTGVRGWNSKTWEYFPESVEFVSKYLQQSLHDQPVVNDEDFSCSAVKESISVEEFWQLAAEVPDNFKGQLVIGVTQTPDANGMFKATLLQGLA